IERIVAPLGLRVDESSPWADARLSDGSRMHAIVPPLSLCGPVLNVRKFSPIPFAPTDLVRSGTLGPRMLRFLAACVRGRANAPRHLLWRLETMALMSDVDLPADHVREQVVSAIDIVVHMARLRDGRRVVFEIASVDGLEGGEPSVSQIFAFRPKAGPRGAFVATGIVPLLAHGLAARGEEFDHGLFEAGPDVPLEGRATSIRQVRVR